MAMMTRALIAALICVNLALIAAVVFHARPEQAHAARRGRGADYMMVTMRRSSEKDAVIVIDATNHLIRGWYPDVRRRNDIRMIPLGPRNLARDFPEDASR